MPTLGQPASVSSLERETAPTPRPSQAGAGCHPGSDPSLGLASHIPVSHLTVLSSVTLRMEMSHRETGKGCAEIPPYDISLT